MTTEQILQYILEHYDGMIRTSAARYKIRPEVVAGIICRESEAGFSPLLDVQGPGGRGDKGHGHGLGQIDDRSWPEFCAGDKWKDPAENIEMICFVLAQARSYLAKRLVGYAVTDEGLERAAVAAYNCGMGRVFRSIASGNDPDTNTAHSNYAKTVLQLADQYLALTQPKEAAQNA